MKIIITKNYEELSYKTAEIVSSLVKEKSDLVFCLPAGSSPIGMYQKLIKLYNNKECDFSSMITFNMDEYVGLAPDNTNSYAYFSHYHFLDHININPANIYHFNALTDNLVSECERYVQNITDFGGLDLAITGIGDNGHIAFNEPNKHLIAKTHVIELDEKTIKANSRFFEGNSSLVPSKAFTIGMEEIMKCKNFLLVASGKNKAQPLAKLFSTTNIDPLYPVSFLRMHPNVTFILDEDAASLIPSKELENYA